jgi:hypothetical protein
VDTDGVQAESANAGSNAHLGENDDTPVVPSPDSRLMTQDENGYVIALRILTTPMKALQ